MEEPGRLWSNGSLRVGHEWATSLSLSCIGVGNGNPLQCPCLENPRDGGAWRAAIYGVTQSQTRLKWLSSSSRDNLEKAMATHSSTVAWRIPGMGEAWWAAINGVAQSWTWLKRLSSSSSSRDSYHIAEIFTKCYNADFSYSHFLKGNLLDISLSLTAL